MGDFDSRLMHYHDEMRELYMSLYHDDEKAFEYFVSMLRESERSRSIALKAWDERRTKNGRKEAWYKDNKRFGMLTYVENFAGTLGGVKEHLSYIKKLGINYLHLMPLLQSPEEKSDGGYAVSDFRKVDPRFGTMEDLFSLALECHENGISLCLDLVMNHTSEEHEWARRARNGEKEYQDRYFFYDGWETPNRMEETLPEVFPTTAPGNFTWCEGAGKVVMTTFYPYQWDLNYYNPVVFNDMTANMLYLCNRGVDIVRLDATPYIWKREGTNCRNLPEVHRLVRLMRIACDIVCPGTLLLGEVVMEPKEVVPYFGSLQHPECHLLYNVTTMASTWHTVATKDVRLLSDQLSKVFSLPKEYVFLNYLRCHDDIGWGLDYPFLSQFGIGEVAHKRFLNDYFRGLIFESGSRGELYNDDPRLGDARLCGTTASLCGIESAKEAGDEAALKSAVELDIMLHAFLLTLSGIPVLYSGDEIAKTNDTAYRDDAKKAGDSRYLHRGKFDWESVAKCRNRSTPEGAIHRAIKALRKIRSAHRAFVNAADTWLIPLHSGEEDHSVLGIGRYHQGEKVLAFFNFSPDVKVIRTQETEPFRYLAGTGREPGKDAPQSPVFLHSFILPGCGFSWFVKK